MGSLKNTVCGDVVVCSVHPQGSYQTTQRHIWVTDILSNCYEDLKSHLVVKNNYNNQQMHIKLQKIVCNIKLLHVSVARRHVQGIQNAEIGSTNTEFLVLQ